MRPAVCGDHLGDHKGRVDKATKRGDETAGAACSLVVLVMEAQRVLARGRQIKKVLAHDVRSGLAIPQDTVILLASYVSSDWRGLQEDIPNVGTTISKVLSVASVGGCAAGAPPAITIKTIANTLLEARIEQKI
jgi:hypothetical protein